VREFYESENDKYAEKKYGIIILIGFVDNPTAMLIIFLSENNYGI